MRYGLTGRTAHVALAWWVVASSAHAQAPEQVDDLVVEQDVWVETSAGRIATNIYRPNKPGRFPVLISMGPYGKDDLPAEYSGIFENGQISVSEYAAFETPDPAYWVHYDYVVIAADSPGAVRSEGNLDLFGPIEASAFYDLIEWAGVQSWSNGNVGLSGVSYFAMSQWPVAAMNPPSLKAIMPAEGLTDLYRDAIRHGGIPHVFAEPWTEFRILRAKNPAATLVNNFAEEARERPFFDDFWESMIPDLAAITVPAYVITSWPDQGLHTRGTLLGYEQLGSEQKWLDVHGRKKWEYYYSRDSLERQRRFFDHFLKGLDNGMPDVSRVRYERRRGFYDGDIIYTDSWPPSDVALTRLFLRADRTLSLTAEEEETAFRYPPTQTGNPLTFTHTFEQDTELTGGMKLRLWVEAEDAGDMDLFVGVSKLDRRGNQIPFVGYDDVEYGHVAGGWLRVSRRELDDDLSTESRPFLRHVEELKLQPGERVATELEILPSSTLFRRGESIELRIQGTELPGAGAIEHNSSVNTGVHVVHVGGVYDAHLLVPVVP